MGPMGTCLEGEWDEVMEVVKLCYERMSEDDLLASARQGHEVTIGTDEGVRGRAVAWNPKWPPSKPNWGRN